MTSVSPQRDSIDDGSVTPDSVNSSNGQMYGPNSMLEGLYGTQKRKDVPQKRKRAEAIVIDDDEDDEKDKEKKRTVLRHKGTGIVGEYMREGKDMGPPSNSVPVDLTKGMFIISHSDSRFPRRRLMTCNFRWRR